MNPGIQSWQRLFKMAKKSIILTFDHRSTETFFPLQDGSSCYLLDKQTRPDYSNAMQVTREGDYGIRSVLYLARQPLKKVSFVNEISEEYKIPRSFLAKILQKLVRAKIVRSYRGVKGGFSLARHARDITVLEVLEAIEGKLALNICIADKKKCNFSRQCPSHTLWLTVQSRLSDMLKKTSIEDLARQ